MYEDEFVNPGNSTCTVEAPEGKKFVSASWTLCTEASTVYTCENLNANSIQAAVCHKPSDDLTEWEFWVIPSGGAQSPAKLKVKMVTIDA